MRDHAEVCPLSRRDHVACAQSLSIRLQDGIRFLRDPIPAAPSARLAARFPFSGGQRAYHVPHTRLERVRPCLSAGGHFSLRRGSYQPPLRATHLLVRAFCLAAQHLRLVSIDDVYQQFVFLAIPSDPAPDRLGAGSHALSSRARISSLLRDTLCRGLPTFDYSPAGPGRVAGAEPRVSSLHRRLLRT